VAKYPLLMAAAGGMLFPVLVSADDLPVVFLEMSLEQLAVQKVSVASLSEQLIKDAPSSVSVFTHKDIARMGNISTLEELLNYVPGFQSSRSGEDGTISNTIAVRGRRTKSTSPELLIQIDGVRLNDSYTGGALKTSPDISLHNVKRVEIIRGPGSALYGSNAFSGVVNIVTDNSLNEVYLALGSFDQREVYFNASHQFEGIQLSLSGRTTQDEGDEYFVPQYNTITGDPKESENFSFSLSSEQLTVSVRQQKRKQEDFIRFGQIDDQEQYSDERNLTAGFEYALLQGGEHRVDVSGDFLSTESEIITVLAPSGVAADLGIFPQGSTDKWLGGQLIKTHLWNVGVDASYQLGEHQRLQYGALYQLEQVDKAQFLTNFSADEFFYSDDRPLELFPGAIDSGLSHIMSEDGGRSRDRALIKDDARRHINSYYVQLQREFQHSINMTVGLRHDRYSDFGSNTSPRAALTYSEPSGSSTYKVMYGEAFRAPSAQEQFQFDLSSPGNPQLKPETIKTLELAWIKTFQSVRSTLTLYDSKIEDGVSLEKDSAFGFEFRTPSNGRSIDLSGVEWEMLASFARTVVRLSYAEQFDSDSPNHSGSSTGSLIVNHPMGNWNININSYFHGSVRTRPLQTSDTLQPSATAARRLDSYWVHNASLVYSLSENRTLSLSARNIFDTDYQTYTAQDLFVSAAIPNRGRSVTVALKLQW